MKLLVLYDGSLFALRAAESAAKLVKAMGGGEVTLLQVVEFWETGAWGFLTLPDEEQEKLIAQAKEKALADMCKAEQVLQEAGAKVEKVVLIGEVVPTIIEYADQMQPDLIVMGSRGRGPIKQLVLGGICHKVLQLAHQPVMVVK
ncbi:universal stress protein [Desulfothermobacter acidiphilus]|uniref:universal stress protein n=1 Tax=Desulfothermobacter acidiphilus TaxID=1938353 RepID=UPI003F8C30A0